MPSSRGFTLVEILVTVAIISVAAAIAIPNLRKFNQDQELITATGDLINVLKQAQSNAQSGIKCPNGQNSASWKVTFSVGGQYTLSCIDSSGTTVSKPTVTLNQIGLTSECRITGASFVTSYLPVTFNSITQGSSTVITDCISPQIFTIRLLSTKTNQDHFIKMTQGGVIYEAAYD